MGFSRGGGSLTHYNFKSLQQVLLKARKADKKIAHATYARVVHGTKAEPKTIAIRHHFTDILLFHDDGSIDISTCNRCDSVTTKMRFTAYASVHLTQMPLKAVNGFGVRPKRALFLCYGWGQPFVPWNSDNAYIRMNPNKSFSGYKPYEVECIVKTLEMRRAMRKVGKIVKIALGVYKLSGENKDIFKNRNKLLDSWLIEQYKKPLEETDYTNLPFIYGPEQEPERAFKKAMEDVRWAIARYEGYTGVHQVHSA